MKKRVEGGPGEDGLETITRNDISSVGPGLANLTAFKQFVNIRKVVFGG